MPYDAAVPRALAPARLVSQPWTLLPWPETAYAPLGETYATSGATDVNFTRRVAAVALANPASMTPDVTTNLYDFPAREYSIQGRWPSPDPAGLAAANPSNPQSWNRYAYVLNNPLALSDPSGFGPKQYACSPGDPLGLGCAQGGGGGGPSCTLNGIDTPCGIVSGAIGAGAAAICPNNDCGPYTGSNGSLYSITLTSEGFNYINPFNGAQFSDGSELGLPSLDGYGGFPFPGGGSGQTSSADNSACMGPRVLSLIPGVQPSGTSRNQGVTSRRILLFRRAASR